MQINPMVGRRYLKSEEDVQWLLAAGEQEPVSPLLHKVL